MSGLLVTLDGPLVQGDAMPIVDAYVRDAVWDVASQGLADVNTVLDASIQHPTPYYETQTTVSWGAFSGGASALVHDRGIIYGWWLEGIGSRNFPVTSFRGYHAFEKGAIALNSGEALRVAEATLKLYMPRLRGEG